MPWWVLFTFVGLVMCVGLTQLDQRRPALPPLGVTQLASGGKGICVKSLIAAVWCREVCEQAGVPFTMTSPGERWKDYLRSDPFLQDSESGLLLKDGLNTFVVSREGLSYIVDKCRSGMHIERLLVFHMTFMSVVTRCYCCSGYMLIPWSNIITS
jgi:hypothetical protein